VVRSKEDRLPEHHIRRSDSNEGPSELRAEIGWHVAPRKALLGRVGQGNGWVEVCSGNRSKSQNQRDESCTRGKGIGQQSMATFFPARRSPMMPEPTIAASSRAVPAASAAARLESVADTPLLVSVKFALPFSYAQAI
jgi:hypothetical protein